MKGEGLEMQCSSRPSRFRLNHELRACRSLFGSRIIASRSRCAQGIVDQRSSVLFLHCDHGQDSLTTKAARQAGGSPHHSHEENRQAASQDNFQSHTAKQNDDLQRTRWPRRIAVTCCSILFASLANKTTFLELTSRH